MSHDLRRREFMTLAGATALGAFSLSGGTRAFAADPVPIGVIIPGSTSDRGWMQSGYTGMKKAEADLAGKIKITSITDVAMADMDQALTSLAMSNKIVIGAGGQCETSGYKIAKRFPNVKFSVIGGGGQEPLANYVITDGRQAQIAYVAGVAAAMLSKTGVINFVGGMELPPIVNAGIEFGNGARSVNPNIKCLATTTGDFDDVAKAKEATLAAIAQGSDIHYHILNLGLRGMEQAAREKKTKIIGSYFDRCGSDEVYVAFSVTGTGYMLRDQINRFLNGSWKPGFLPYGLEAGPEAANFVFCSPTPALTAKIDQVKADIVSGKVKTLPS